MLHRMRLARGCLRATHTLTHTVTRTLTTSATSSLFVHNLSFDVTEEALARHVSKVVTSERVSEGVSERVEVRVELHRNKRKKPTGTAVVYFECVSDAVVAERCLQGSRLYGRELRVREDLGELLTHSLTPHSSEEVREGGSDMASKSVYVGNLHTSVTPQQLRTHMSTAGPVARATILRGSLGDSLGCAVVQYRHAAHAQHALTHLYNTVLNGRLVYVREDREAHSNTTPLTTDTTTHTKRRSSVVREKGTCVVVGNIDRSPYAHTHAPQSQKELERHIHSLMSAVGRVRKVLCDAPLVGKGRGKVVVEYASRAEAVRAVAELHGREVGNKKIIVQPYGN